MFGRQADPGADFRTRMRGSTWQNQVVVLSHKLWESQFADLELIGHTINLDNKPYT